MPRKFVGIYDRPPLLRRRRVWLPLAIGLAALVFWIVVFLFFR